MTATWVVSFSLYIHIPYCESKCPYCDFNSYAASKWPEDDYVRALILELESRVRDEAFSGQPIATIFFGGGTPSLFQPESIARVIESARRICGIDPNAEITIEANPGTVDAAKLAGMRGAGVNRISFGAQSFNDATLRFLGRIHSAAQTRDAVGFARSAGFERINLDLIFAVPGQTLDDLTRDIDEAVALGPDHISAYNLTFEEGTPFFTDMKRGKITPLDTDVQAAMYSAVRRTLPASGYPMYEISNYAPGGHEARHNLTYWRGDSYLGLGAGAHSFARCGAGGRRWWNQRGPAPYIAQAIESGIAEAGCEEIDARTAAGEFVFLNLRLTEGFALDDFRRRFEADFDDLFGARAARLLDGGLLLRDKGRLRLSDRGLELADSVFAEFV